jgi:hypothetical protein
MPAPRFLQIRGVFLFVASVLTSVFFQNPAQAAAPTVLNVTSTAANGIYGIGDQIDISIQFSENVTVSGTPTLTMRLSSTLTSNINYTTGSGTNTLVFRFTGTSATSTSDLDYSSQNSLSGTIKNGALEQAVLTLPAPGSPGSLGANKSISFESFGSQLTSTPTFQDSHLFNLIYSPTRDSLITADGNNLVEVDKNLTTKTTLLSTGASIGNLALFGNTIYWTSGTSIFKSSLSSPSKVTHLSHTSSIIAFSRTNNYWVIVDSSRGVYKYLDDGTLTKSLVTTLSSTIADNVSALASLSTSPNSETVLWRGLNTGIMTEIALSDGSTSTYANLSKCSTSLRGIVRLSDGSELYGAYSPTNLVARRWPDGRVSCSPTSIGPWMFGALAASPNHLFAAVYGTSSGDYRIWRYTPLSTSWGGSWSDGFTGVITPSTISAPALSSGGRIASKGIDISITVQTSVEGSVAFRANGKYISGCRKVATASLAATCSWRPSVQGAVRITTVLKPTSGSYSSSSSSLGVSVIRRNTTR